MPIHKDLPDSELHNPKGFDAADANTVLTKSSAGLVEYVKKAEFGADFHFGDGDPIGTLGIVGDIYIDRTDGDVFKKVDLTLWEFQFNISSAGGISDHGFLDGPSLLDDDHPQYLLVSGLRAMSGDLDLGGHSLLNVLNLNGVPASLLGAHANRHNPSGADPLATAAPTTNLNGNTANSEGSAESFSRSDHGHEIDIGTPVSQTPNQANAEGSASQLARSDHIHNIPTDAPVPLTPDATNNEGTAPSFARSDHVHNLQTDAPTSNLNANTTNQEGAGPSIARNDHSHAIDTGIPVTLNPDQPNAAGTSPNLARADHIHNIPAEAPVSVGTSNDEGVAASFARSDHVHNVFPPFEHQDVEENTPQTTTATLTTGLTLTTPSIPAGRYRIGWFYEWGYDDISSDFVAQVQIDDTTTLMDQNSEPSDSFGGGPGGTDQRHPTSGFAYANLNTGVHFIDLDFGGSGGITSTLWRARLEIRRVA